MAYVLYLDREQEKLLKAYRQKRKEELNGKLITNQTALSEIVSTVLEGIKPPTPMTQRLQAIEARLLELENEVFGKGE